MHREIPVDSNGSIPRRAASALMMELTLTLSLTVGVADSVGLVSRIAREDSRADSRADARTYQCLTVLGTAVVDQTCKETAGTYHKAPK
jgi:hypothetical protein